MGYLPFFGDAFCSANAFVGETCVVWRNSLLFVEEIEKNMNLDKDQSSEGSDQIRRSGENWKGFLESDGNGKGESESATRLSNSDSISVPTSLSMAPPPPSKRRSIPSPHPFLPLCVIFSENRFAFTFWLRDWHLQLGRGICSKCVELELESTFGETFVAFFKDFP
jgi:hypothetical protein